METPYWVRNEKRRYNFTCNRDIPFTARACVYHKTETVQYGLYSLDTIWFLIRIRYTIFSIYWKSMIYQKKLCQMSHALFLKFIVYFMRESKLILRIFLLKPIKLHFWKINSETKTNQSANRCIDALWIILHHLVLTQIVQYMLRFASQMTSSIKYS